MKYCKSKYCLAIPFMVAVIVFSWVGFTGQNPYDALTYAKLANQWTQGIFDFTDHFSYRTIPVFFTAVAYRLFGMSDFATSFFPVMFYIGGLFLIINVLHRYSNKVIITALFIQTFTYIHLTYSYHLMPDTYIAFLFLAVIAVLSKIYFGELTKKYGLFVGLAMLLFLAFITKGTVLFLLPLLGGLFLVDMVFLRRHQREWGVFVVALSGLLGIYFFIFYLASGDFFIRFRAIGENAYLNRCSYEAQPLTYLFKRIAYEWFFSEITFTVLFPIVFLLPWWIKRRFRWQPGKNHEDFLQIIALLLILSGNFLSISFKHYVPLCPDPRHFLFLIPAMAVASAPVIVRFFEQYDLRRQLPVLGLTVVFAVISYFWYEKAFFYFYLPAVIILLVTVLWLHQKGLYLFWLLWIIWPVKFIFFAQLFNIDLQKQWTTELKQTKEPLTVISNYLQQRFWEYYNHFQPHPYVQFLSYEDIELKHIKPKNDKVYLWLNFATRDLGHQSMQNLPLYARNTYEYKLLKEYPERGMFLYEMQEETLEKQPFLVSINDYRTETAYWQWNDAQIKDSLEEVKEFSSTFILPLDSLKGINKLTLHARYSIFVDNEEGMQLVVQVIDTAQQNIFWKGLAPSSHIMGFNAWWTIDSYVDIDIHQHQHGELRVYIWNPQHHLCRVKDWKIRVYRR